MKRASPAKQSPDFFSTEVNRTRRFYLDLRPPPNVGLTVVCGGLEHCLPNYAIHRTRFPFYALEYVARGQGKVSLRGKTFSLSPGRIFSYGPGVAHHIEGSAEDPLVKYFVDFTGRRAAALLRQCHLPTGSVLLVNPPAALQALFDELIEIGLGLSPKRVELCSRLLDCLTLKIHAMRLPPAGLETAAFQTYRHCREHIERHFQRLRTLTQIAEECHLDAAYLCRLFRRYDHQSPYHYLIRLKVNLAAELLQQPANLVKQAAGQAGFADPFHFSRLFKNILGISPAAFRRMQAPAESANPNFRQETAFKQLKQG